MALTASNLIDAAKKRTFGARGRQKISDAMLLEELSYQDQLLTQMTSQIAPDLLARVTGSITFTDAGNTAGYTLQDGLHYRDFVHKDTTNDKYTPIDIIRRADRLSGVSPPAGMLRTASKAAVFYPVDPRGKEWNGSEIRNWFEPDDGHTMSYSYVPLPGVVDSLSDTLTSPDMAREIIVSSLELSILMSAVPMNEARVQVALTKRQGALDAYRMQLYKFAHPQGSAGGSRHSRTAAEWVSDQVGG